MKLGDVKTRDGIKFVVIEECAIAGKKRPLIAEGITLLSPIPSKAKRIYAIPKIVKDHHPWVRCLVYFPSSFTYRGYRSLEEYNLSSW